MRSTRRLAGLGAASAAAFVILMTLAGFASETGIGRFFTLRGAAGVLVIALIHTPLALAPRTGSGRQRAFCAVGMLFGAYLVTAFFLQEASRLVRGLEFRPLLFIGWMIGVAAYGACFVDLTRRRSGTADLAPR